jgi:hypothetical protein
MIASDLARAVHAAPVADDGIDRVAVGGAALQMS